MSVGAGARIIRRSHVMLHAKRARIDAVERLAAYGARAVLLKPWQDAGGMIVMAARQSFHFLVLGELIEAYETL
jgi:hypothetical protein